MNTTSKSLELTVRASTALTELSQRLADRARHQHGQTAAEYLGIIVVVAAIIVAIVGTHLDTKISKALETAVKSITSAK